MTKNNKYVMAFRASRTTAPARVLLAPTIDLAKEFDDSDVEVETVELVVEPVTRPEPPRRNKGR